MTTVVSPSRENIDDLILDSVSGRRFGSIGDLLSLKRVYEDIDNMDSDLNLLEDEFNLLGIEIDVLKEY